MRVLILASLALLTACGLSAPMDPITAYGDSLTFGIGASSSYPTQLAVSLHRTVVNDGVPGETSTQITARLLADTARGPVVIWMGTNDAYSPAVILANVARSVAALHGRPYLILPVMTRTYEYRGRPETALVLSTNDSLRVRYGARFLDVRSKLVAEGDAAGIAADTLPSSVRADQVHLNDRGYALVAAWVAAALQN
jgi:lysophospholipase L1-like esterase